MSGQNGGLNLKIARLNGGELQELQEVQVVAI